MPTLILLIIAATALVVWLLIKSQPMQDNDTKDWIKAGGILGMAILLARVARLPLATILTALPFILPYLRQADSTQQKNNTAMTREEAALILGVRANASQEEIQAAHRSLILKNHPDKGGSDYLAAKINQARDVLLS